MTPTPKLRFVRREQITSRPNGLQKEFINVLQQWWVDSSTDVHWVNGDPGEWRDVPLEKEE